MRRNGIQVSSAVDTDMAALEEQGQTAVIVAVNGIVLISSGCRREEL